MLWEETAKGIRDAELAEVEIEIEQVRKLLDGN
jgi:hypothetical protein